MAPRRPHGHDGLQNGHLWCDQVEPLPPHVCLGGRRDQGNRVPRRPPQNLRGCGAGERQPPCSKTASRRHSWPLEVPAGTPTRGPPLLRHVSPPRDRRSRLPRSPSRPAPCPSPTPAPSRFVCADLPPLASQEHSHRMCVLRKCCALSVGACGCDVTHLARSCRAFSSFCALDSRVQ